MPLHSIERQMKSGITILAMAVLSACGGGGGDSSSNSGVADSSGVTTTQGSGASALACLPTNMFTAGYTYSLNYNTTDTDPSIGNGTRADVQTLIGSATFNGVATQKFQITSTTTDSSGTFTSDDYSYTSLSGSRIIDYGSANLGGTPITLYNPGNVFDFSLNAGGYTRQTYTETSPQALPTATSQSVTDTITFVGLESVTVPAGTFSTCHFRVQSTSLPANFYVDLWVSSSKHGVLVKSENTSAAAVVHTEVLASGTFRGVTIVGP